MTVLTTIAKAGPYAGAGTTGPFTVPFRFLEASHLRVIRNVAGVDTVLTINTDYTVSGVGAASGSVTLIAALSVGQTLTVVRNVPATQEADYVAGDAFPAESHEVALDKLTMIAQQLAEEVGRSVKVSVTSTTDPDVLLASIAASEVAASASASSAAATYDLFDDRYLGSKTSNPTVDNDGNALLVGAMYWNSVSNESRTWNGSAWVATNTVVPDNSVTTAKLADLNVTTEKMANAAVTFPKMQNIATSRLLGRASAGTGGVEELTGAQATALLVAASETVSGRVELADATEAAAGTDATRALSPAGLRNALAASGAAPVFACRAWVNFSGTGTVTIRASGNVSSLTDNGTGDYTVNFTTSMPDTNYCVLGATQRNTSSGATGVHISCNTHSSATARSTGSVRVATNLAATGAEGGNPFDVEAVNVAIFR
jgi:hypothetical protein